MTQVRLGIVLPTTDGTVRRPSGSLEFRPTKRRNVGSDVVLPAPVTKGLTDPPSIAELAPTGPDWAWQVVERVQGGSPHKRTLAVPDSASVVDYADLIEVDPATLEPTTTTADPFWWTQVTDYVATHGGAVATVNGQAGAVVLGPADVGAQPAGDYATNTALTTGLAGKVNSSTYTTGLAGKQDAATLGATVAADATVKAAFGRKTWIDLRDFTGYDGTGTNDQTAVLQAAVTQAQAADGRTIYIPNGRHKFTGTVLMQGATSPDGWSGKGGIYLVGESMEGAILQQTVGLPLLQWGSVTSKVAMGLSNLTLAGPGKTVVGSIGLDSRTTGGSYTFDTIHVRDFEIGIREHDNTLTDARSVNVRNCGKGWALGYFSDAHTFLGCRADGCDIGYHVGYFDPTQGEAAQTESHGLTWLGGMSNLCGVGIYVEGSATEAITVLGTYFEQYSDVAIRIGHADGTSSVSAGIDIKGYFNGDRKSAPTGKVAHAIEINNAKTVRIGRGGYRSHTVAAVNVANTGAKVTVDPGNFSRASGESDVKLPDGTLINVGKERPLTVGQVSGRTINRAATLPTASADWAGGELDVAGTLYRCGADGAGGYAWYAQPTAKALSSTPSASAVVGSLRQRVVTGAGRYYTAIGGTVGTGQVGAATAAAIPIFLDTDVTITELAAEVTTAGAAGSLLRLGLYSDNAGAPGTLLVDAGTVDSTTIGVKTLAVSQAVSAGIVWAVACSQGSPTTEPTLRIVNGPIVGVPAVSAGSQSQSSYKTTGLATGGLPGTWSLTGGIGGIAPRVQIKVA